MGAAIRTVPDTVEQANPITHIATAQDRPRSRSLTATPTATSPTQQSQILADALAAVGATADLTILPGASHADAQFDSTLLTPTIAGRSTVLNR